MARKKVVVVGGGIAGAATAWSLAREHGADVVLLECERQPGAHATARNAAILRTAIHDPCLHALARDSARFYREPPAGFADHPLLRACGTLLCATAESADELALWATDERCNEEAQEVPLTRLHSAWPQLAPGVTRCWLHPQDGVLDVHAILHGFLSGARQAGAELRMGAQVVDLLRDSGGAIVGVRWIGSGAPTPQAVEADAVVLAGGAWAAEPAAAAGLPLELHPRRRHLLVTAPLSAVHPGAPVVWILGDEFYFRPESGGLLLSACDEEEVEPAHGERTQPVVLEALARKTQRWLPAFLGAQTAHFWAATRTFADDQRFLIGPDPRAVGLYWAAALGGHGISCGYAVGRLAAAWAVGTRPATSESEPFLPARILPAASMTAIGAPTGVKA